jgi:hypothetical protein
MDKHFILGVHITNRMQKAGEVQKILTEYGCNVRTRLGLHQADDQMCSPAGVILLELVGEEAVCEELAARVAEIPGVEVQRMIFTHP